MKGRKLFLFGNFYGVFLIASLAVFFGVSITLMICGVMNKDLLIIGGIFLACSVAYFLMAIFIKFYVVFDLTNIKVLTILHHKKNEKSWSELKKIEIKFLKGGQSGEYICMFFSDEKMPSELVHELLDIDDIILLSYSPRNEEILKKYTNVQIEKNDYKKRKWWQY